MSHSPPWKKLLLWLELVKLQHTVFALPFALAAQHLAVGPGDLSRIQLSFFHLNGAVSVTLFLATWAALVLGA
jgi:4-hydroxybenzoate polyprenyltransferase